MLGGKYGKNMLDDCLFPRRMRSALQWSRPETNVSIQPTCRHTISFTTMVCYAEVLFQPSFSWLCMPAEHETLNAWVGLRSGERSTLRTTERDTAQTERALLKESFDTSSGIAVCIQAKEVLRTPSLHRSSHHMLSVHFSFLIF